MKKLICIFITLLPFFFMHGQTNYLAGAVPEVNGKVIFSKTIDIPVNLQGGSSYDRLHNWLEARMKQNNNDSRIVLAEKEKGQLVAVGIEDMVFKSKAFVLDKTTIKYQVRMTGLPEKCLMEVLAINYNYEDKDFTAEEYIVDGIALNKKKGKIYAAYKNHRVKTIDLVNELFTEAANSLLPKKRIIEIEEIEDPDF